MEASTSRYQELMDMLNTFMETNKISFALRIESRAYMRTRQAAGNLTNWQDLLSELSPDLREAFARQTHPNWALSSFYFSTAHESPGCSVSQLNDFQAKAAALFTEVTFPSGEKIIETGQPLDSLYLVKRGVVAAKGRVMCKGSVFGEDIIMNTRNTEARATYVAMAFTFTVVEALETQQLKELLDAFPEIKEHCRKVLIWQITREHCWAYASAVQEIDGKKSLRGAKDRELIDHYKWKVKWLRMDGLRAVRVFKAVIRIQKVLRGHWARGRLLKSQSDGIGAIEIAVRNAVSVGTKEMQFKLLAKAASGGGTKSAILRNILAQVTDCQARFARIQGGGTASEVSPGGAPPPLPDSEDTMENK